MQMQQLLRRMLHGGPPCGATQEEASVLTFAAAACKAQTAPF